MHPIAGADFVLKITIRHPHHRPFRVAVLETARGFRLGQERQRHSERLANVALCCQADSLLTFGLRVGILLGMDETNPRHILRQLVEQYGTQKAAAMSLGISQPYLSDLMKGRRTFSDKILKKLGLRSVVVSR